jgi:hypothetical protein
MKCPLRVKAASTAARGHFRLPRATDVYRPARHIRFVPMVAQTNLAKWAKVQTLDLKSPATQYVAFAEV